MKKIEADLYLGLGALLESAGKVSAAAGIGALLKVRETLMLPLRPQEVSSPLANRTPRGKEELVNALGHLTSHSLPLGSPSLARLCDVKSHLLYRARRECQSVAF